MGKASNYRFSINDMCTLKFAAVKIFIKLKFVSEKGNEMIAIKTKNVWLNINHRCNENLGFGMRFN